MTTAEGAEKQSCFCGVPSGRGTGGQEMKNEGLSEWRRADDRPLDSDEFYLVVVNGKYGNITFVDGIEMGAYLDDECAWFLPAHPHIEHPRVTHWMPLPEPPGSLQEGE